MIKKVNILIFILFSYSAFGEQACRYVNPNILQQHENNLSLILKALKFNSCKGLQKLSDLNLFLSVDSELTEVMKEYISSTEGKSTISKNNARWAQEYIGADLAKLEISEEEIIFQPEIAIIDSGFAGLESSLNFTPNNESLDDHGTNASNLIKSDSDSSIGVSGKLSHYILANEEGYNFLIPKVSEQKKANIVNNSMIFWANPKAKEFLEALKQKNVLFIASGGNNYPNNDTEGKGANDENVIGAGWLNSNGLISEYSSNGNHIDIVVPTGLTTLSSLKKDSYSLFSASSAAAPIVTGVAANILSILGDIPAKATKDIILNSTLKMPFNTNENGKGSLNAYKAVIVAKRIKNICNGNINCISKESINLSNYTFLDQKKPEHSRQKVINLIPSCAKNKSQKTNISDCKIMKEIDELRKYFLLTQDENIGNTLSCFYESVGFSSNSKYYKLFSKENISMADIYAEDTALFFRNFKYVKNIDFAKVQEKLKKFVQAFNPSSHQEKEILIGILYSLRNFNHDDEMLEILYPAIKKIPMTETGNNLNSDGSIKSKILALDIDIQYFNKDFPIYKNLIKRLIKDHKFSDSQLSEIVCIDKKTFRGELKELISERIYQNSYCQ